MDGLLEELRADVQVTVGELRELAHGIYPPLLRDRGLPRRSGAAANRAPSTRSSRPRGSAATTTELEAAVYFCCLEAMQNAGKHAGEGSTITIVGGRRGRRGPAVLGRRRRRRVRSRPRSPPGTGSRTWRDRLGAIGGELTRRLVAGHGHQVAARCRVAAVGVTRCDRPVRG